MIRIGSNGLKSNLVTNPAHGRFKVLPPPLAGQREVRATLFDALGQAVLNRSIALNAAGGMAKFSIQRLAVGMYTLRPQAEGQVLTKRVVLEWRSRCAKSQAFRIQKRPTAGYSLLVSRFCMRKAWLLQPLAYARKGFTIAITSSLCRGSSKLEVAALPTL
ncbi:T9SS type A sorting domain-containing protein [Hymenobacter antarcticus]